MTESYIICGIDTDCGKTVTSILMYEYIKIKEGIAPFVVKPVQTGKRRDTEVYQSCGVKETDIINFYTLEKESSIHSASAAESKELDFDWLVAQSKILLNTAEKAAIFELAGGLMSPITDQKSMLDFVVQLELPVVLVVQNYLGAINHALLTIEVLKQYQVPLSGILYNNRKNGQVILEYVAKHTDCPIIGEIPELIETSLTSNKKKEEIVRRFVLHDSE